MRYGTLVLSVVVALLVGLVAGLTTAPQFLASQRPGATTPPEGRSVQPARLTQSSKNVFRVYGPDVYRTSVAVSQLIYPGPRTDSHPDAQPGVAILVPSGADVEPFYAEALPAAALIHHPHNGPILFTDPDRLNPEVAAELRRLNPTGGSDWPQVFIIGRISQIVENEVRQMGFRTERISGVDQYETAALIDERLGSPGHVMIVRGDDPSHGLPGVAWIAHMMDSSVLFTEGNRLPEATLRALQARQQPFALHVLGPEEYVSSQVERQLQDIVGAERITRIAGIDPAATAVAVARFKQGAFGWGIEGPGHGFYFVDLGRWQDAVAGSLTSHLGGHGPLLFVSSAGLPSDTRSYLEAVRPSFPDNDPTKAPLNRGYLIVQPEIVNLDQQAEIDWLLESIPEGGAMPGMNGGTPPSGH